MNPTFFPRSEQAWTYVSSHAILRHVNMKHPINFVTKKTFNESPLTIYANIVKTNKNKFIVQFVRFRSRGTEFCAFLLEAILVF